MKVDIKIDDHEVRELLARFTQKEVDKLLRTASTKAGAAARKQIRAATPVGPTGNLRKSVAARRIRKGGLGIVGVVVGPMGRKGAHRHLVAFGTKAHEIKAKPGGRLSTPFGVFTSIHHPGSRANPYIPDSADDAGIAAAEQVIDEALT